MKHYYLAMKNAMIPAIKKIAPRAINPILSFFSFSLSSDHGLCCFPKAIPIETPTAIPAAIPITKPVLSI